MIKVKLQLEKCKEARMNSKSTFSTFGEAAKKIVDWHCKYSSK
jgi:hypothetical protein